MKNSHFLAWVFYITFLTLFFYFVVIDGAMEDYESPMGVQKNYKTYYDEEKAEFFRALWDTFQSENPRTESWDDEYTNPSNIIFQAELGRYYANFDIKLNSITPNGCPLKNMEVPSKYQNPDARHRNFLIFYVENCKPIEVN